MNPVLAKLTISYSAYMGEPFSSNESGDIIPSMDTWIKKRRKKKKKRKDKLSLLKSFMLHLNFLFSSTYIFNVFHKCSPWFPNIAGVFAVKIESQ